MRVALPYLTALRPARDEHDFADLAHTLARRFSATGARHETLGLTG
jgi:hypothetical protein